MDAPDPDAVRAAVTTSPVDDAFAELDSICRRYEDSLTLEIAEETYADVARGVDTLQTATCYVDSELSALKRRFPGTVFSKLPAEYDAYELTTDDATLRLKFGQSHADRRPVDAPYESVTIAVPTGDAYFERVYEAFTRRSDTERTSTPTARDRQ
ncbi:hypothetical protein [Haloplanus sp. C73]|uniref:hypothetical protein n=1 Tax=Haloplanus sp. C73 TaxID=3421641 RepID=UPI003EC09423